MKRLIKILLYIVLLLFIVYFLIVTGNLKFILNSVTRTLITDDRYELLLNGLKETLIISFSSIIFGSFLGIFICYLRMNKYKLLKKIGKIIISLLQGLPITVLLLVFYYVIFGSVDINPVIVCIITFSLYFSGYVSEIYRGSLENINAGQKDSAYSMGFTKIQTLKLIIFPQVISYIIPVFKNESVALIKLTSIVGFISVLDLTRASEIIRNRTYEAFCPLLFTAFIYYIICYIVGKSLDILYKKINPRKLVQNEKNIDD